LQSAKVIISIYLDWHAFVVKAPLWNGKNPEILVVIKLKDAIKTRSTANNQPIMTKVSLIARI
jgi:hypothetical protein